MHRDPTSWRPYLHQVFLGESHARGIARGCAWGTLLGLIPWTNLTAVAVFLAILMLRVHLATTLAVSGLVALLALQLEPVLHVVGQAILTFGPLQGMLRLCFQCPLVPWTALDHTTVAGAVIVGSLLQYPIRAFVEYQLRRADPSQLEAVRVRRVHMLKTS